MKKEYKSSIQRLAKLFEKSRELWKQRAAEKQKKLRAQEIRIRDLEKSRDLWKERAQTAEQQIQQSRNSAPKPNRPESIAPL